MTAPAVPPARPARRRAGQLAAALLLFVLGAGGGAVVTLTVPGTLGAEPSPAPLTDGLPAGFEVWREAYGVVRDHYVDAAAANDEALVEGAIRGMVDALGDVGHTVYLTREELEAEQQALDGTVIGIGVSVDARPGGPVIISVLDGSPADAAGLRAGERILAVDGARVDRLSIDELVRRVRGEPGSAVELRIEGRDGRERVVSIVRARIDLPAASWAFVPGSRIAVIRLVQFSSGAGRQVAEAAREALAREASAVVLDLRGNPGGLLDEAVAVTGVFLEDGPVYRWSDRSGGEGVQEVRGEAVVPDLPVVVLVDQGSASSAEIVAGALRDAGRARIVGEATYGTGTVLNVFRLSDGSAIRLGVQRWRTPGGEDVFAEGLVPDVTVRLPDDGLPLRPDELRGLTRRELNASGDAQLRRAIRLLEAPSRAR